MRAPQKGHGRAAECWEQLPCAPSLSALKGQPRVRCPASGSLCEDLSLLYFPFDTVSMQQYIRYVSLGVRYSDSALVYLTV